MELKTIGLSHGWSAKIKTRDWLTERDAREISRALIDSVAVSGKLEKGGFNDADPSTYEAFSILSEEERDRLSAFQTVLICKFVVQLDAGTDAIDGPLHPDTVDNLPQGIFDELAGACLEQWKQDEDVLDPKAPTDA